MTRRVISARPYATGKAVAAAAASPAAVTAVAAAANNKAAAAAAALAGTRKVADAAATATAAARRRRTPGPVRRDKDGRTIQKGQAGPYTSSVLQLNLSCFVWDEDAASVYWYTIVHHGTLWCTMSIQSG